MLLRMLCDHGAVEDGAFQCWLRWFAVRTFLKGDGSGSYYRLLMNHDLSFKKRTKKLFWRRSCKGRCGAVFQYVLRVHV